MITDRKRHPLRRPAVCGPGEPVFAWRLKTHNEPDPCFQPSGHRSEDQGSGDLLRHGDVRGGPRALRADQLQRRRPGPPGAPGARRENQPPQEGDPGAPGVRPKRPLGRGHLHLQEDALGTGRHPDPARRRRRAEGARADGGSRGRVREAPAVRPVGLRFLQGRLLTRQDHLRLHPLPARDPGGGGGGQAGLQGRLPVQPGQPGNRPDQVLAGPAAGEAQPGRPRLRDLSGGRGARPGRPGHRRAPQRAQEQALQQLALRLSPAQQGHQHPSAAGGARDLPQDQQERRIRAGRPVQGRRCRSSASPCRCSSGAPSAPSTPRCRCPSS